MLSTIAVGERVGWHFGFGCLCCCGWPRVGRRKNNNPLEFASGDLKGERGRNFVTCEPNNESGFNFGSIYKPGILEHVVLLKQRYGGISDLSCFPKSNEENKSVPWR